MSITYILVSLINSLTIFKAIALYKSRSPYKAVNWILLGFFAQILGAVAFGELSTIFLCLSYAALLIHLNRNLVPDMTFKEEALHGAYREASNEQLWVVPTLVIAVGGALMTLLPVHSLNVIAPWLSVYALVSSKILLTTRQIPSGHYLMITVMSLGPISANLITSNIPGVLLIELALLYQIFNAGQDIVMEAPERSDLEAKTAEKDPVTENIAPLSKEPELPPTRSFLQDRMPIEEDGIPVEHIIPDDERVAPIPEIETGLITPSKVLKEHQRSNEIKSEARDEFFPDPEDVPYQIELPKSPLAGLGQAVTGLFKGKPKPPRIRREPKLSE